MKPDPTVPAGILALNSGSSSLKFALYDMGPEERLVLAGELTRIGLGQGAFAVRDGSGRELLNREVELPDHEAALKVLFPWLKEHEVGARLKAVGHRLVHGGADYSRPQRVGDRLLAELRALVPLAPDHLPHEIKALEAALQSFPDEPQVACFDTAFHRSMPEVAQRYGLPRHFFAEGVRRYGFHGLAYEYILQELAVEAGSSTAAGRLIVAHLGNGASMAAVHQGRSRDTTMGLTPAGGLVMSTRVGDIDPGVILYLLREKGLGAPELNLLINAQAGLLGVSGLTSDMRDLLNLEVKEAPAAEAVELFCYIGKKFIGALAAVLGGLETLIFTGGIGENSPLIRERLCRGLEFLGISLDSGLNQANAPVISRPGAPVTVRVMKADEDLMIARHTFELLKGEQAG